MIIEVGDLRCGANETFPGPHGGCLFGKKRNGKESKLQSETEKEQESVVALIRTGKQELN